MIYKNCKGRARNSYGYILIRKTEHPFCNSSGYIMEHRLIMENKIGRYLKFDEVIHHINGIKDDNRIKNLKLMESKSHRSYEWYEKRKQGKFYPPLKRPDITMERIKNLMGKHSITVIAKILNCSRQTIYRKLWESY